jgi:hypothetical protein
LYNTLEEFAMEISTGKTKIMHFREKKPVRSKTCINNRIMKQAYIFDYLGCNIFHEGEKI